MGNLTSWLKTAFRSIDEAALFGRFAATIVVLALITRLGVLLYFWPTWVWHNGHIQDDWNKLAINWVTHGTFGFQPDEPTIRRGPVFPLLEIPLYLLFGENYAAWSIALLLFDTGTCLLLVLVARQLWGNRAALLAGLFYSVYLPIIYYIARIEQFTSALPLVFLWFYLFSSWDLGSGKKWTPWALGLVSGVLILNKTVYLPVTLASVVGIVWLKRKELQFNIICRQASIFFFTAALVVAPWTYRNYVVTEGALVPVQALFWQLVWQKEVLSDLDATEGAQRPDGRTLQYILSRRAELFDRVEDTSGVKLTGPKRELYDERVFRDQVLEWLRSKPAHFLKNVASNVWGFWAREENLRKTLLMLSMQMVFLGAALLGLGLTIKYRQLLKIRFGLLLVLTLWAEYSLVLGWGRFSLDTVPVLALVFGIGIDEWMKRKVGGNQVTDTAKLRSCVSDLVGKPALNCLRKTHRRPTYADSIWPIDLLYGQGQP
jgi:4-amino-4-deoxy-L-arabinose transferase-like glycosyltransferase